MQDFLPVKGTRDFPPEQAILREKIISILKGCFQTFGFDPIVTPIVESFELYKGKSGEEIENKLIWRFKLPYSEKEYALRPELTPSLVRFYSRFRPKLPFKRYEIGRVYRYDDPQKGRYREFWQADFDIVGSKYPEADAEVLNLVIYTLKKLGFKEFEVRVNSRILLSSLLTKIGIEKGQRKIVYREIDKLDKLGEREVFKNLSKFLDDEKVEKLKEVLSLNFEELENQLVEEKEEIKRIKNIFDLVEDKSKIKFELSLVRGLDYYTSFIFEVFLKEFKRSIAGGGRYDNLIEKFCGKKIPCIGGSFGIEPIIDVGLEKGIFNLDKKTYAEIMVVYFNENILKYAWELTSDLRNQGFKVFLDLTRKNFFEQMKLAIDRGIKYAVILGEDEIKEGKITLQNLETKERRKIEKEELKEILYTSLK